MLLAPVARSAEAPRAVATASRAEVSVGDTFTVTVRVTGPAGAEYTFPPEAADEAFELRSEPSASNPPPPGTHRYRAAVFAVGEATVPPIPVRYRLPDGTTGEIRTAPIPLRVVSLLPKDKEEQKLADVRGPVRLGVGRAFWVGLGVAVLSIAALAWWLVSRRRTRAPAPVAAAPAIPPDQDARRALDALWASGRLSRGEYRPFYIELTAIAKRYLERRLDAPIVEMTTAEMLAHLRSRPEGADLISTMRDLSGAADTIKFARGSALVEEAERHWTAVGALIATLEARLRPAPPEGNRAA
jgi:hypothetical protein